MARQTKESQNLTSESKKDSTITKTTRQTKSTKSKSADFSVSENENIDKVATSNASKKDKSSKTSTAKSSSKSKVDADSVLEKDSTQKDADKQSKSAQDNMLTKVEDGDTTKSGLNHKMTFEERKQKQKLEREERVKLHEEKKLKEKQLAMEAKKPRVLTWEEANPKLKKEKEKEEKRQARINRKKINLENVKRYDVDPAVGLNQNQVAERTAAKLTNKVEDKNSKSYAKIFLGNIFTFFNILVFIVAGALIYVGAWTNLLFLVITLCNIMISIIQEIRAKKTIEKISLVSAPTAVVIRDGYKKDIPVSEIVLDDIILFGTGKQVCTDCKVVDGEVEVNESLLTGESVAIKKKKGDILYAGSFIASGKCSAIAERIGQFNYSAKLSAKAKEFKSAKSELLKSVNTLIKGIGFIIIPLAVLMFYNNYSEMGSSPEFINETVKKTAGSIIGMIPAGMFLLTSVALAVGVIKLAKKKTLVQDLYSIEMLARTDVLCLDKTGTITDGTMKVNSVIQLGEYKHTINDIMGSMLTALEDNNQTSRALATHFGYSKEFSKQTVLPFSSSRKLSAVTFKNNETYVFGAPEFVLKEKNLQVDNQVKQYASKGFRVILLASCDGVIEGDKIPSKRTPIALIIIEDHIREEAAETLKWFKENSVQIKIISGDNPITVSEVSKRVGVENADKFISLEGLTEQQVMEAAEKYTVFGRVSPEQKMFLVKALKNKGHKVAMTGDGVNDILAMKESDCSIAMASGSEATRNVSHLVLLDSNFASMPNVVAEGRRVINNIQKSSSLFLMKTFFTIFLSIFCLILHIQYPFNTNQVVLLETFVIGLPAFFLSLQPNKEKIQGRFLPNLISNSLPGAIVFTLDVIVCFAFDRIVGTQGQFETMSSLIITFSGLVVLFKLCKPFDIYRSFIYIAVVACVILIIAFVPFEFFEYIKPNLTNSLFIICVVQFSYPLYANVVNLVNRIRFASEKNNN